MLELLKLFKSIKWKLQLIHRCIDIVHGEFKYINRARMGVKAARISDNYHSYSYKNYVAMLTVNVFFTTLLSNDCT